MRMRRVFSWQGCGVVSKLKAGLTKTLAWLRSPTGYFLVLTVVVASLLLFPPIQYARLDDDEAIYYVITKDLVDNLRIPAHLGSTLVPFLLWAPAFLLGNNLLWLRLVTALVTLGTAVMLYLAGSSMFTSKAGFSAAMLFLFSFQALRFGIRVVPDPFGSFFAMLSLWLLVKRKAGSSGAAFSLAAYSYQFWIPMYLVYALQAWRQKLSIRRFLAGTIIIASVLQAMIFTQHTPSEILQAFVKGGGPQYVSTASSSVTLGLGGILEGWLEFSVLSFIPLLGIAIGYASNRRRWLMWLIALQFLLVSLYPGFAVHGGTSHYPYGLVPLLALCGGAGFPIAWEIVTRRPNANRLYAAALLCLLAGQVLVLNQMATSLSVRGVQGVYDLGYQYDLAAIDALKHMDRGGPMAGETAHGLLIDPTRYDWGGSLDLNPTLFMGYKTDVIFKDVANASSHLQIVEIGPYVIVQPRDGGRLSDYISVSTHGQVWLYRGHDQQMEWWQPALAGIMVTGLASGLLMGSKNLKGSDRIRTERTVAGEEKTSHKHRW
jgi:hypothetical protein